MVQKSTPPRVSVVVCAVLMLTFTTGCATFLGATTAGLRLNTQQQQIVSQAIGIMRDHHLSSQAKMASVLLAQGKWLAASSTDRYMAQAEKSGDTPFAYTLPDDAHPKRPIAIVLASRFFDQADSTARAALMIHEMGHWLAFEHTGKSTEYDGYKAEYDTHRQLGLTDQDGLTYFAMLDGVVENVVPIDKSYKQKPDVKQFEEQGQ